MAWKLALVQEGKAPASLLDTYEQDRLPVMRDVLRKTEGLTSMIGSENPIVRSVFNHLAPYIGGAALMQENSTTRLSQLALGYRDSPLSANSAHGGTLHAGDRVSDMAVRHRTPGSAWSDGRLLELLDPSRFTLVVAHADEAAPLDAGLGKAAADFGDLAHMLELAPAKGAASDARHDAALGRQGSVFLVRPDGYLALASGSHSAASKLAEWQQRWLLPQGVAHAA